MGRLFVRDLQRRRSASSLVVMVPGQEQSQTPNGTCKLFKRPSEMKGLSEPAPKDPEVTTVRTMGIAPLDPPKQPEKPTVVKTMGIAPFDPPKEQPKDPGTIVTAGIAPLPKDTPKEPQKPTVITTMGILAEPRQSTPSHPGVNITPKPGSTGQTFKPPSWTTKFHVPPRWGHFFRFGNAKYYAENFGK